MRRNKNLEPHIQEFKQPSGKVNPLSSNIIIILGRYFPRLGYCFFRVLSLEFVSSAVLQTVSFIYITISRGKLLQKMCTRFFLIFLWFLIFFVIFFVIFWFFVWFFNFFFDFFEKCTWFFWVIYPSHYLIPSSQKENLISVKNALCTYYL